MTINEETLEEFSDDFADAMLNLENKYGLAIELGNITYTPAGFFSILEVKNLDGDGRTIKEQK